MRPGIPGDQVQQALAALGLNAPDDLLTWYGWHDGYQPRTDGPPGEPALTPFLPRFEFSGLAEMCGLYLDDVKWLLDEIGGDGMKWFPILRDPYNDLYVVMDCGPETPGRIAALESGAFEPWLYRPSSLEEPVGWWCDYLETGKYVYDPETERFGYTFDLMELPPAMARSGLI
jgi:hypothetical protein